MQKISAFILLSALCGCMTNNTLRSESAAQVNVVRLREISLGMSEEEVFRVMRYPDRNEQIEHEESCYDIWFYITRSTAIDQRALMSRNLTPLIFKDGILVAKGYDYYHSLYRRSQEPQIEDRPTFKQQEKKPVEDKGLEKALEPTPSEIKKQKEKALQSPKKVETKPKTPAPIQQSIPKQPAQQPSKPAPSTDQPSSTRPSTLPQSQKVPPHPIQPQPKDQQGPLAPTEMHKQGVVSMCSRPSSVQNMRQPPPPPPKKKNSEDESQEEKEEDPSWDEQDQQMQEQQEEQNFDFW